MDMTGDAHVAVMEQVKEAEGTNHPIPSPMRMEMEKEVRERSPMDFKQLIKGLRVHKSFGRTNESPMVQATS